MANQKKESLQKVIFAAILSAFTAVMAQISFPLPSGVPVTLQTFAVALCAFLLGAGWGCASIGVYLLVGAIGVPVFSSFSGGVQVLFGSTGGFLYGFIPFVILCGLSRRVCAVWQKAVFSFAGLAACHLLGVVQFAVLYSKSFPAALLMVSAPYIVKDIVSVAAAAAAAKIILKRASKVTRR